MDITQNMAKISISEVASAPSLRGLFHKGFLKFLRKLNPMSDIENLNYVPRVQ